MILLDLVLTPIILTHAYFVAHQYYKDNENVISQSFVKTKLRDTDIRRIDTIDKLDIDLDSL